MTNSLNVSAGIMTRSTGEEIANAIIHGLGFGVAIAGLSMLVIKARGALANTSCALFASSLILMFLSSTLYHSLAKTKAKKVFQVLDHSAIYFLIAGTYTPFCLLGLRGAWGWSLFGVEWAMALAGIALHAVNIKSLKKIEVVVYLVMGWAVIVSWWKLSQNAPFITLAFLIAGGLCYTLGTLWYRQKNKPGAHIVWHVFVLLGAICHWWSVWFLV
ncbi:MAG: hemolysin III family protein [Spirochaetaceae bacterium]|jgi:hemolysin III|nr:hemolysin III family protein [Spirochaetaceae bacterium]